MKADPGAIVKIAKQVIEAANEFLHSKRTEFAKSRTPREIQRRMDRGGMTPWSSASDDLRAVLAASQLMWEEGIADFTQMNEEQLQLYFGVNSFNRHQNAMAVKRMAETGRELEALEADCDALDSLAGKMALISLYGGPDNVSQIMFDRVARDMVARQIARNKQALEQILTKLRRIYTRNKQDVHWHPSHTATFQHALR